eukprot:1040272-Rhodomonas_salina.2
MFSICHAGSHAHVSTPHRGVEQAWYVPPWERRRAGGRWSRAGWCRRSRGCAGSTRRRTAGASFVKPGPHITQRKPRMRGT